MQTIVDLTVRLSLFYLFIFLGFLAIRYLPQGESINKWVVKLLVYIFLPILMIDTLLSAASQTLNEFPVILFFVVAIHFLGILVMYIRTHTSEMPSSTKGSIFLCVAFNNAIFLPIPLILIFIGDVGIPIVAFYSIGQMTLLATVGTLIGSFYGGDGENRIAMVKKALLFPPFIASMIGIVLAMLGFSVPIEIETVVEVSSLATTYVALFAVGLGLGAQITKTQIKTALETVITRQVIVPIIIFILLLFIPLSPIARAVIILQALMPAAVITVIFSNALELDAEMAATIVTLGTLLLLPVVPFIPLLIW